MRFAAPLLIAATLPLFNSACTDSGDEPAVGWVDTALTGGALIKMDMTSRVGVLLDDIPAGPLREQAAAVALARPADFWKARASRQVRLMYYRLVFRGLYYSSDWAETKKVRGPLPLPDQKIWNITLSGGARRDTSGGHDIIVVDYKFDSMLVSDADSPGKTDPALANIGGVTEEAFNLPTDPDMLLERTGYACMDEEEYPVGSVFEENTWYFFDDSCKSGSTWCHYSQKPQESCTESLQKHTGIEKRSLKFTRIDYNRATADKYRIGNVLKPEGADLAVVQSQMDDERRIVWKYFKPGSCEIEEGVIGKLGWRRLLMFSAVVQNDGTKPVHIGDLTDASNPFLTSNVYEFSACHAHYHFSHYGNFNYNGAPGSKRAFCLEDTNRFHNDESTSLLADHQSCSYQGIGAGWGDEYEFGIPGQWVDITDVDASKAKNLTFDSNVDGFMCEGNPVMGPDGKPVFEDTPFRDAQGNVVKRIVCDHVDDWDGNNHGEVSVKSASGSFVTEGCRNNEIGPNKNCGYAGGALKSCSVGSTVTLSCSLPKGGAAQMVRICEKSGAYNTGTACTLVDSIKTQLVSGTTQVSFPCPAVRDAAGAGGYSIYNASVADAAAGTVTCQ